ncbi:hypothetical protein DIPPA_09296 [Diplonema papillatum]|nr:hypothetical protein DIPPA_09296 [Diplonema papillatum]
MLRISLVALRAHPKAFWNLDRRQPAATSASRTARAPSPGLPAARAPRVRGDVKRVSPEAVAPQFPAPSAKGAEKAFLRMKVEATNSDVLAVMGSRHAADGAETARALGFRLMELVKTISSEAAVCHRKRYPESWASERVEGTGDDRHAWVRESVTRYFDGKPLSEYLREKHAGRSAGVGEMAITQCLILAVKMGDPEEAGRLARFADELRCTTPAHGLLEAAAWVATGDCTQAAARLPQGGGQARRQLDPFAVRVLAHSVGLRAKEFPGEKRGLRALADAIEARVLTRCAPDDVPLRHLAVTASPSPPLDPGATVPNPDAVLRAPKKENPSAVHPGRRARASGVTAPGPADAASAADAAEDRLPRAAVAAAHAELGSVGEIEAFLFRRSRKPGRKPAAQQPSEGDQPQAASHRAPSVDRHSVEAYFSAFLNAFAAVHGDRSLPTHRIELNNNPLVIPPAATAKEAAASFSLTPSVHLSRLMAAWQNVLAATGTRGDAQTHAIAWYLEALLQVLRHGQAVGDAKLVGAALDEMEQKFASFVVKNVNYTPSELQSTRVRKVLTPRLWEAVAEAYRVTADPDKAKWLQSLAGGLPVSDAFLIRYEAACGITAPPAESPATD